MEPTKAIRWFGPMLIAFAIAAMTAILVSVFVQSQLASAEPQVPQLAAQRNAGEVERPPIVVQIEPARIEVIGKRRSSVFETLADWLPRHGGES